MATQTHSYSVHNHIQPMISPPSAEVELSGFPLDQHYYDSDDEYDDEYIVDLGSEDFSEDSHPEFPSAFFHPIARNITAPSPTPQKPSNPAISCVFRHSRIVPSSLSSSFHRKGKTTGLAPSHISSHASRCWSYFGE
ncbi:hypothetical protein B0H11DRAFT_2250535 [Mycena galericulata]|nr:hypothetical protein B0H11DRAFT_2250535 [Mycena galericulata]